MIEGVYVDAGLNLRYCPDVIHIVESSSSGFSNINSLNGFAVGFVPLDIMSIGLPVSPKYSVLRFGDLPGGNDGVLEFLDYGIRVFLVTTNGDTGLDPLNLSAFQDSRLLEWAVVPEALGLHEWIIDGNGLGELSKAAQAAKKAADDSGSINMMQYDIVHSDSIVKNTKSFGANLGFEVRRRLRRGHWRPK